MKYALRKYSRFITGLSIWGTLGFYRGLNEYDHRHKKNKNNPYQKQTQYLYSEKIANGFLGFLFYVNPFLILFTLKKEIYRLEVNIRGLDKTCDDYNEM
jgi:hypothetical protein